MLAWLVFGGLLLYATWGILSASIVLRVHRADPAKKVVLIPSRREPWNPLVTNVGTVRVRARANRRKWLLVAAYAVVTMCGAFSTWGRAALALAVTLVAAWLLNAAAVRANRASGDAPSPVSP
jgi:hypothetical protein